MSNPVGGESNLVTLAMSFATATGIGVETPVRTGATRPLSVQITPAKVVISFKRAKTTIKELPDRKSFKDLPDRKSKDHTTNSSWSKELTVTTATTELSLMSLAARSIPVQQPSSVFKKRPLTQREITHGWW